MLSGGEEHGTATETPAATRPSSADGARRTLSLFEVGLDEARRLVTTGQTVRVRLDVAYLGTGYRGFALQPGQPTVAGALVAAIERYVRHTVILTCAGRTDAGVHARGQVVTLDVRADIDTERLARALNRSLSPTISVTGARVVDDAFDARRSARARRYHYRIHNGPVPDPFLAATTWHVPEPLDIRALRLACDALYGEHDFASFCRRPPAGSLVRRVTFADWFEEGERVLRFEIEASSFCQQMVRSVVGTMVDMGVGRRAAGEMAAIVAAGDRRAAPRLAPPQGLCLWEVTY